MTRYSRFRAGEDLDNPIYESPGPVTADSLAAESYRHNGAFAQNRNSRPLDVLSENATFATTDTSAARTIPSAPFAEARPTTRNGIYTDTIDDADTLTDLAAASGTTFDDAYTNAGTTYGYPATTTTTTRTLTSEPSITEVDYVDRPGTTARTRGPDVFEDDAIADAPTTANASYNTGISTLSDPSRLAEYEFESRGALNPETAATPTQSARDRRAAQQDYSYLDVDEEV
ncbi:hypothetical protein KEM54_000067 [Ascosphaera aggregata]|nr:hypothetical protein KEM54_000067 [Ascosphaera aggregata]